MHAEGDLVVTIVSARHRGSQVIEDPLAEALHESKPMRGREVDTRLPFRGVISAKRRRRSPELHGFSSLMLGACPWSANRCPPTGSSPRACFAGTSASASPQSARSDAYISILSKRLRSV